MLDKILALDTKLLIFLNSLGSETYDGLWLIITKQAYWAPFFVFLLYIVYKKLGLRQTVFFVLAIAVLITFTDQATNLVKNGFQRLRPCSNPEINSIIRVVQVRTSYSFFSGHASNSMAAATFIYFVIFRHFKYGYLLFLWPLVFAYSRIYLGLHYPLDIICGYLFGIFSGYLVFKIYQALQKKYFPL
ncbi:phosphatase PAP2 family protein [Flavobacterium hiemivividum]|uniref:Phosphatase PAP2 family protein n=1 Tax=Flavobacterium hiemivividum TaxID=2541734 RepID=A0A4R5CZH3_9FLAO|nr:phosphatase PAP2 family protein [Flavobacterium hiemivividum]TDE06299.1 phosphatase PAP2 family protein [Flavobacterium hiemivividum]